MSAVKRDLGVKDWGHLIEGHGGMLDRVDSVCFAAPIFFI
jgi:phosphatidate cytidylyltransferase